MKKLLTAALALGVLLAVAFAVYAPFPGERARPAVGEEKTVARGGRTISYFANGSGPRIALVASAGREASDFNELVEALVSAGYRTLAVDAPGIGASASPQSQLSLDDLAGDVAAVIEHDRSAEDDAPSVVIGHAFGNRVARAAAQNHPDLISATILIAAGGQRAVPEKAEAALKNGFDPRRTASQRLADVRYAFFADGADVPVHWRKGWHAKTAILQGRATDATPSKDWRRGGDGPMLVIQAADDRIAPKKDAADILKRGFPTASTSLSLNAQDMRCCLSNPLSFKTPFLIF